MQHHFLEGESCPRCHTSHVVHPHREGRAQVAHRQCLDCKREWTPEVNKAKTLPRRPIATRPLPRFDGRKSFRVFTAGELIGTIVQDGKHWHARRPKTTDDYYEMFTTRKSAVHWLYDSWKSWRE